MIGGGQFNGSKVEDACRRIADQLNEIRMKKILSDNGNAMNCGPFLQNVLAPLGKNDLHLDITAILKSNSTWQCKGGKLELGDIPTLRK